MSQRLTTKSRLPAKVDEEYMQFCYELFVIDEKGQKINYQKESTDFWNKKIKELIKF